MKDKIQKFGGAMFTPVMLLSFSGIILALLSFELYVIVILSFLNIINKVTKKDILKLEVIMKKITE